MATADALLVVAADRRPGRAADDLEARRRRSGEPEEGDDVWPGIRDPRRRQPARDARQGQGEPGGRAPSRGGHAGAHHPRRVSGSQLSGAPDSDVADRHARARSRRRSARSRRSSTSTRSTAEIAPDLSAAVDVLARGGCPCRSVARRGGPCVLWGIGAIVALVAGGGWFALGPTASADGGVETAEVVRGDFIDVLPIRGEVRARRTVPDHGAARRRRSADRLPGAERRRGEDAATSSSASTPRPPNASSPRSARRCARPKRRSSARAPTTRSAPRRRAATRPSATTTSSARSSTSRPARWSHGSKPRRRPSRSAPPNSARAKRR